MFRSKLAAVTATTLGAAALALTPATALGAKAGDLDPTFGTGGVRVDQVNPTGLWSLYNQVAPGTGGRTYAATSTSDATGVARVTIAAYRPDGTLDPTWSDDGISRRAPGMWSAGDDTDLRVSRILVQPDGKVVVAGFFCADIAEDPEPPDTAYLQRYRTDGTLDPSFGGGDGTVVYRRALAAVVMEDHFYDVGLDSQGRLLAIGGDYTDATRMNGLAVRFLSDGSVDPSFGAQVRQYAPPGQDTRFDRLAIRPDDGYLVTA